MRHIILRMIGSVNEDWHSQAIHSYLKRLSSFAKVEMIELKEGHEGSSKPNEEKTRLAEAGELLKGIPKGATIIALDEVGKNLSSYEFAAKLKTWTEGGRPIIFLIGGSWGLDSDVRKKANFVLSFGKQTLPHCLARIVLLEQLYRTEMILGKRMYHK